MFAAGGGHKGSYFQRALGMGEGGPGRDLSRAEQTYVTISKAGKYTIQKQN